MRLFVTGATGFVGGAFVGRALAQRPELQVDALVRAQNVTHARDRLWEALSPHLDAATFLGLWGRRLNPVLGDLVQPGLGLSAAARAALGEREITVVHCAASVNRRSTAAAVQGNVLGTLEVATLARDLLSRGTLRRFVNVSTVSVAGPRQSTCVGEDEPLDFSREDHDAYSWSKRLAERMVHTLLPGRSVCARPSSVIGHSASPRTTQFDMLRAYEVFRRTPVVAVQRAWRQDIVPVDWVADALLALVERPTLLHDTYHLSAGTSSVTFGQLAECLGVSGKLFAPWLGTPLRWFFSALAALPRGLALRRVGQLMKVFWPYAVADVVFDNRRLREELGLSPPPFVGYARASLEHARATRFKLSPPPALPAQLG